jgi:hypothetical protein
MCGLHSATTTARRSRPPALADKELLNPRPGHIPTPPRPRPVRARPALPQELAAPFWGAPETGEMHFDPVPASGRLLAADARVTNAPRITVPDALGNPVAWGDRISNRRINVARPVGIAAWSGISGRIRIAPGTVIIARTSMGGRGRGNGQSRGRSESQ